MKIYVALILTLVKLVSGAVDKELQEKFMTLSRSSFVEHFNAQNYSWKIKEYSDVEIRLDKTIEVSERFNLNLPVHYHNPDVVGPLPDYFDSRETWPNCPSIGEIYDQNHCSSCWAHGVANTASDRTCIHTNEQVYLSEQDLECVHENHTICEAGIPEIGFLFWKENGLVTRNCKPYQPLALDRRICEESCVNASQSYVRDKHYARQIYSLLPDDYQIRAELYLNGPIKASMAVFEDFQNYRNGYHSGIYVHTHGNYVSGHSVRVIGYGEEDGVKYWLAANSMV